MYSGESLLTILNTSHAVNLSLLTWRGSIFVWLSSLLREDEKSLIMISKLSFVPFQFICTYSTPEVPRYGTINTFDEIKEL